VELARSCGAGEGDAQAVDCRCSSTTTHIMFRPIGRRFFCRCRSHTQAPSLIERKRAKKHRPHSHLASILGTFYLHRNPKSNGALMLDMRFSITMMHIVQQREMDN
jgi:hypothetical protein